MDREEIKQEAQKRGWYVEEIPHGAMVAVNSDNGERVFMFNFFYGKWAHIDDLKKLVNELPLAVETEK